MGSTTWTGGSLGFDEGRYTVATDWSGQMVPQAGETLSFDGLANSQIGEIGALITFPIGGTYTLSYLYPAPSPNDSISDPAAISNYAISSETIDSDGLLGANQLWLEDDVLSGDTVNATGTTVLQQFLNDDYSGSTFNVGTASGPAWLQMQINGADTSGVGLSGTATTVLPTTVNVSAGSTFDVQSPNSAGGAPVQIDSNGEINVSAGGTLNVDDTDGFGLETSSDNDLTTLVNGGTIAFQGAAGATTTGQLVVNTIGSGTISVNGGSGPPTATELTIEGSVTGQTIDLTNAVIAVDNAELTIQDPSLPGLSVSGGAFVFGGNGTLELHEPPLTSQEFNSTDTELIEVPNGQMPFTTPIENFGPGDTIDLLDDYLGAITSATYQTVWNQSTGILQVISPDSLAGNPPNVLAQFDMAGTYQPQDFQLTGNPTTETLALTSLAPPACLARGTRLAVPGGEVAVEDLAVGDEVVCHDGRAVEVVWLGRRRVDCARHPEPRSVWPVRVEADAFGPAEPASPVLLSPDHAVFVDGVFVPVGRLLNGISVTQKQVASVWYFHVELERHEAMLAQGLPVESYVDTGNRRAFANADAAVALHPAFGSSQLASPAQVDAIRARLAAQVGSGTGGTWRSA